MITPCDGVRCNTNKGKKAIGSFTNQWLLYILASTHATGCGHKTLQRLTLQHLHGQKVEKLPADKKKLVKEFLDAFIFKADLQKQLAN